MSLELLNNPILATIQDIGRLKYTNLGVSVSGALDEYAYLMANKILDNDLDENIIEIFFSNVSFKVLNDIQVVITGAKCEFFINDKLYKTWKNYILKKGDIIKIGKIIEGSKVYLAIKGGFAIQKELLSNSTTIKENLGGLDGTKLKKGDILASRMKKRTYNKHLKEKYIPTYNGILELRVILSYQNDFFNKKEQNKFFNNTYTITNDFNRMACKLEGEAIFCDISGIVSEGIAFGSIQIPSDGKPIILLKERQTIGGYPKIGSVLNIDCFKLAQKKAKMQVIFKKISLKEAQDEMKKFYKIFY